MRRARTITAWILLAGSLAGWPLSAFTFAADEPQAVLALSWIAIIIGAAELLTSSQVHEEQADNGSNSKQ
jgi:uncharacterized membrane protein YfcA